MRTRTRNARSEEKSIIPASTALTFLLLPALLYLGAFFLYPLFRIVATSVTEPEFGIQNYLHAFGAPVYLEVIINTLKIGLTVTLICLSLGYPVAYMMVNVRPVVRQLLLVCVLVPFCSSLLVRTYAWMVLLQTEGVINQALTKAGVIENPLLLMYNRTGVTIGMTHILLPFMILPLFGVMKSIDRHEVTVALSFGATPFQAFRNAYFPHTVPGVIAGCFIVFVQAIGYFITPALLGGRKETMIAMLIDTQINYLLNWGFGSALATILFLAIVLLFALYLRAPGIKKPWKSVP